MILPISGYADAPPDLGMTLLPGKIMENTQGIIEVFSKTDGVSVDKLIATSSDQSVVQVLDITQDDGHMMSKIKINAIKAGDVKIAIAAPGFSSSEFDLTVFKNSNIATNLLIKTTPTSFATNGPTNGYVAVESANSDGIPTPVTADMPVSITTSDSKIVNPVDTQIIIKKGEYYAIGKFVVDQPGTALVYASSPSMQAVSSQVTVNNVDSQNTVQVYVYPTTINAFKSTTAYVIAQLHDTSGNPVIATNDVPVTVQVTNATGTGSVNTSKQNLLFQVNEPMVIKKGSYWAYVPMEVASGAAGKYNVTVSTKGNLVSSPAIITANATNLILDTKSARMDALPIMMTGQKELIGVVHLEDPSGNLLLPKEDLFIHIDSSNPSVVSIPDVQLVRGSQAALVFGQVGTVVNPVTLNVVTDSPQSISPTVTGSASGIDSLNVQPLLSKVLTHGTFPLSFFMTKDSSLDAPTSDFDLSVSPIDSIQTGKLSMIKTQSILVSNATLVKDGLQAFSATAPTYSTVFNIEGLSMNAKSISMVYPDKLIAGLKSTIAIELLDAQQIPAYASHDIDVKFVSSDPSVIQFPDSVQIKTGSYFSTFDVEAKSDGQSEIAILADEIPLSKFTVNAMSIVPDVSMASNDFTESGVPMSAEITTSYKQLPLKGLSVDWKIDGAQIKSMDTVTNDEGKAKITLVSDSPGTIHIDASVLGGEYQLTHATKDVTVNALLAANSSGSTPQNNISLFGVSPLFLGIPIVAGVGILFFKKKEMFEGISEKINLQERFSELKERMAERRQN